MPVIASIAQRARATSALLNTIRNPLAGEPGTEIRVYHDHATEMALDLRNEGAGPIFRARNAAGTTMLEVTQSAVNFTGATFNTMSDGSFATPTINWGASFGLYKAGTNSLGVASGTSTRTLKLGAGAFGMVEVVQTNSTPGNGVYSVQGGLPSTPVTPDPEYAAIQGDSVLDMDGLTHVAVKGNMYAVSGNQGFAIGGDFQSIVPAGSYTSGAASNSGTIGLRAIAHTLPDAVGQHVLTGLQVNARGEKSNDIIHGAEINLSTLDDAPSTDPAHRIWLVLGTEANKMSRRGTGVDAFFALLRKKLTPDDTTNVKTVKNCFFFGDGGGTVENFPFDNTSTFMVSDVAGTMGGFINLSNVVIDDGAGTDRGSIFTIGSGGSDPALDIRSTRDGGTSTLSGWIGIGTTPVRPLHIKTAENSVMCFTGTTANFTTSSVGAAGGASALPATPAGYLRINVGGSNVLMPYYVNA